MVTNFPVSCRHAISSAKITVYRIIWMICSIVGSRLPAGNFPLGVRERWNLPGGCGGMFSEDIPENLFTYSIQKLNQAT